MQAFLVVSQSSAAIFCGASSNEEETIKRETVEHLIGVKKEQCREYAKDDILNCAMPAESVLNLHDGRKTSVPRDRRTYSARNLHSLTLRRRVPSFCPRRLSENVHYSYS